MSNLYQPPPFSSPAVPSVPKQSVNDVLLKEAQQEINQLRDELFQAKRTAWQKTKDFEETNTQKNQLFQQHASLTRQINQLQQDADVGQEMKEELGQLRVQVDNFSKENDQLKEARRILQQELADERSAKEAAENAKGSLEAERSRLLHEIDGLKSEVKFLKRRVHEVEDELVASEQEALSLRSEARGAGNLPQTSNLQREASLSRAKSLELQEERIKVEKLAQQLLQQQHEIDDLSSKLSKQNQKHNVGFSHAQLSVDVRNQLEDMDQKVTMFKKSRDKLLTEVDTQSVEIDRLLSENSALQNSLSVSQEIQNKWKNQAEDALNQIEKLKDMMEESASWVVVDGNIVQGENELQKKVHFLEQELVQGRAKIAKMDLQIRALCAEYTKAAQCNSTIQASLLPALNGIEGRLMRLENNQILPEELPQS
eukprot:TRINITY_DN10347_c0_g3_i2.p1 TRINITY_DN10347_c0_g3~~TRINITY_DN10347_c0_g3_i2.p1  ORF type:complete len:435 (-),score=88.54 TRINITY_DN10347_c0_g3_i2:1106-2386(-)